jgi:hypothetical protein
MSNKKISDFDSKQLPDPITGQIPLTKDSITTEPFGKEKEPKFSEGFLSVLGGDPTLQGLSLGWADELAGQVGGLAGLDKELIKELARKQIEENKRVAPVMSGAAELVGMGLSPTNLGGVGNLATAARFGIQGGLINSGKSKDEDKIEDAVTGGLLGAGVGALTPATKYLNEGIDNLGYGFSKLKGKMKK